MGTNALRTVRAAVVPLTLIVVIAAMALRPAHEARGLSFNPHLEASLTDSSPGAASDIKLDFSIDAPDPIFESIVTFLPSEMYIAPDDGVPNGAVAGMLEATATLGLFNGDCNTLLPVHFDLIEANTDIHDLIPLYGGYQDFDGNGLPENVDRYPEFLTRLAPNLQPIERLYGQTLVAGVQTFVNFVVFEPGTKIARLPEMNTSMGYPVVVYLNDPTSPSIPFAITDFCTPLGTDTTIFGTSRDNPDTTANESGTTLKRNPQNAGGYNAVSFVRSQWDADGDGVENTIDPCPFTLDPDWNPRGGGSAAADADADGLPNSCDPSPNDANINQDNDNYQNRQDSCPLVSQEYYAVDYDHDGIGDACDLFPEDPSQGGAAQRVELCLTSEFDVGGGGSAPEVVCPSGPDVILPPVLMIDPGGEKFRVGTVLSLYAQLTEPISNEPIAATTINFEVTGANPTTGSCTTSNYGNCQFNYAAPNVGADVITASTDVGNQHITNTATVEWLNPPENDDFTSATVIEGLPFDGETSLSASGRESGEPNICGIDQQSVWFEFTPQTDVFVKIEGHGEDADFVQLGMFDGSTVATARPISCGSILYPVPFTASPSKVQNPPETYLFASLIGGTAYHIQIGGHGYSGTIADLTIEMSEAIRGDTNCDGLRDGLDILGMLRGSVGLGQPICSGAADFDCSGYLNPDDIVSELRLQAGVWSPDPCTFSLG